MFLISNLWSQLEHINPMKSNIVTHSTIEDRLITLLEGEMRREGHGFWGKLEVKTGVSSQRWRKSFSKLQRPTPDMLESAFNTWPAHAFWLATGATDEDNGHTSPFPPLHAQSNVGETYLRTLIRLGQGNQLVALYDGLRKIDVLLDVYKIGTGAIEAKAILTVASQKLKSIEEIVNTSNAQFDEAIPDINETKRKINDALEFYKIWQRWSQEQKENSISAPHKNNS
jgi:hypothetical protein